MLNFSKLTKGLKFLFLTTIFSSSIFAGGSSPIPPERWRAIFKEQLRLTFKAKLYELCSELSNEAKRMLSFTNWMITNRDHGVSRFFEEKVRTSFGLTEGGILDLRKRLINAKKNFRYN